MNDLKAPTGGQHRARHRRWKAAPDPIPWVTALLAAVVVVAAAALVISRGDEGTPTDQPVDRAVADGRRVSGDLGADALLPRPADR